MILERFLVLSAAFAAVSLAGVGAAAAAGECSKFGNPSYVADRNVSIGGQSIRSKVFVTGQLEREEVSIGGRDEIKIFAPSGITTFNLQSKTGIFQPASRPPKAKKDDVRGKVEPEGANKVVSLEIRDADGKWNQIAKTTCRGDGAVLGKTFTIVPPGSSTPITGTMSQTIVSTGPQDPALFKVPAGVTIKR